MQKGRFDTEPFPESSDELRRQTDLGYEDEYLLSGGDDVCDKVQVHLGFAAACYTVEHIRAEARRFTNRLHGS